MGSEALKRWVETQSSRASKDYGWNRTPDHPYEVAHNVLTSMLPLIEACQIRCDHASDEAYERDRAIDKALRSLGVPDD